MNIDKNTCWYNEECYEQMIAGATGKLWPVLEKSGHWPILKELLGAIPANKDNKMWLLDIGCGAGCLGQTEIVKERYHYIGADLMDVIHNVAQKVNPIGTYLHVDILNSDLKFIPQYGEVVVMNAFIDVMQHPVDTLIDIIDKCPNYVIIHRQFVYGGPTKVKQQSSYGGFTYISNISEVEFNNAIRHFKVLRKLSTGLGKDNYSYLLQRVRK